MSAKVDQAIKMAKGFVADAAKSLKTDAKRIKMREAKLKETELQLTLLVATVIAKLGNIGKNLSGWITMTGYGDRMRPYGIFYINVEDGFKNPDVMNALEFLTKEFEEQSTRDSEHSLSRTFSFTKSDMDFELRVEVDEGSPTCRRVEVGEEIITQKKFKIVCE